MQTTSTYSSGSAIRQRAQFSAGGFSGDGKGCAPNPDGSGLAKDFLARLFGCPDCPGMAAIAGTGKFSMCYQLKRTTGKVVVVGAVGLLAYFLFMRGSE